MNRKRLKKTSKILQKIKSNIFFLLIFFTVAGYYAYKLFNAMPWYDELWSFSDFITAGPVRALTYWPRPNNHMLYNGLSSLFNFVNNPFINLRTVSYIAALLNIILIYKIFSVYFSKAIACIGVLLYIGMSVVNEYAIQGRGYTLGMMFILIAILQLLYIQKTDVVKNKLSTIHFLIFAFSLAFSLFTVPSQAYPVLAVCMAGGFMFLIKKQPKNLFKLIAFSVLAAFLTFLLYTPMLLYHGFYKLIDTFNTAHLVSSSRIIRVISAIRMYDINLFDALMGGIKHMTGDFAITSISRTAFYNGYYDWILGVLSVIKVNFWLSIALIGVSLSGIGYYLIKKETKGYFLAILSLSLIVLSFFLPFLQCVLPFSRTYTHFAFGITIGCVLFIRLVLNKLNKPNYKKFFLWTVNILLVVFAMWQMKNIAIFSKEKWEGDYYAYGAVMAAKEYEDEAASFLCGTEYIYFHSLFHIYHSGNDKIIIRNWPEEKVGYGDIVILYRNQITGETEQKWPEYFAHNEDLLAYLQQNDTLVYENERYFVFINSDIVE